MPCDAAEGNFFIKLLSTMPFEPLKTDEKLAAPLKKPRDTDTVMLFGCTTFVFAAILTYGLGILPFFLIDQQHIGNRLLIGTLIGAGAGVFLGFFASRGSFIVGACGYLGGSMAAATFLLLRIQQILLAKDIKDLPQPDFPEIWVWTLPAGWVCLAAIVALLGLLSGRRLHEEGPAQSR